MQEEQPQAITENTQADAPTPTEPPSHKQATHNYHPDIPTDPEEIRSLLSLPIKVVSVVGMIYRINLTIEEAHEHANTKIPERLQSLMSQVEHYVDAILSSSPYRSDSVSRHDCKLIDNLVETFAHKAGWTGSRKWKSQQTLIQMTMALTDDMLSAQPPIVRYQPARTKFERLIDIMAEMLEFFIESDGQRFSQATESGSSRGSLFFNLLFGENSYAVSCIPRQKRKQKRKPIKTKGKLRNIKRKR